MVTSPIESFFMRSLDLLAASKSAWQQLAARLHSQREAYMPEDNPARKSFEAGARTAREAVDRGTAAAEQATRQAEHSLDEARPTSWVDGSGCGLMRIIQVLHRAH
jgi:hypothetical protein